MNRVDIKLFEFLQKIEYDSQKTSEQNIRISLVDFVHIYFKRRFPDNEPLQLEWGYNLVAGCRRFKSSPDIGLFWSVLLDKVCIIVFMYAQNCFGYLFRLMRTCTTNKKLFQIITIKNKKRNCK